MKFGLHLKTVTQPKQERFGERTADQLLSGGEATVTTSRGTLRASLERPGRLTPGMLLVQTTGDNGVTGSSSTRLSRRSEQDLREEISHRLARVAGRGTSGGLVPVGLRGSGPPGDPRHGTSPRGCRPVGRPQPSGPARTGRDV